VLAGGWAPLAFPQVRAKVGPNAHLGGAQAGPGGRGQSALPGCSVMGGEGALGAGQGGEGQC
jgi:hypothetical protein